MSRRTAREQILSYSALGSSFMSLIAGRFKWTGLPDGLTSEQMERFICLWDADIPFGTIGANTFGGAAGFKHPVLGPCILPMYPADQQSIYWLPKQYTVTGCNYNTTVDADDCVIFYNDSSRAPLTGILLDTLKRLDGLLRAMNANTRQQINPWAFSGTSDEIKTAQEAYRRANEDEPVIWLTYSGMATVETAKRLFPIKPGFEADKYFDNYIQIQNRFLTILGVDNIAVQKKERLISAETQGNDQLVLFYRREAIRSREDAARKYNEMFGTNLTVEWNGGEMNTTQEGGASGEIQQPIEPEQ